jgi:flagellar motility protein MotE (MotC chaperone)
VAEQMEKELEVKQGKKSKPFQKFIFLGVVPLFVALIAALIVATISGVNVLDEAKSISKKIPFASSLFKQDSAKSKIETSSNLTQIKADLTDRDKQISQLQSQLNKKNNDLAQAQLKNSQMQQEIDDAKANQQKSTRALKDIVSSYETMSPKKAAAIITNMADTEALKILTAVKPEILAPIMENMDPTQAARFTELMTNKDSSSQ